ncbi:MAG: oligosaccharide flippase family protein [Bacteroidales bacterium]|nr:oligosaccharide flippase family protein [Bacteroidales bacterium]
MKDLNKLAGQTLIYGLGTIVPRFLHYFVLTLFYTRVFGKGEYGVVTELYAFMVLFLVMLTYGMETGFFRFAQNHKEPEKVYSTSFISLLATSLIFLLFTNLFLEKFASLLKYENNPEYIRYFVIILSLDSITAIPFARLRRENRPLRFSIIKLINVTVTIILVLFFLKLAPDAVERGVKIPGWLYNPDTGVGYVFIANMIGSFVCLILLLPEILAVKLSFSWRLWKSMIVYSLPLLIGGLAGTINDALDKMILRRIVGEENGLEVVGEYGASYKIAVLMSLFIQMFRYAVEPFFFEKADKNDAKETYATIMKYFVIISLVIYLGINLYLSGIQVLIGKEFRVEQGLKIVPIVSLGYLLYGIFINLSVWYKINDLTRYGALLTLGGALITIVINILFIPMYGYLASAWAHVACYGVMVVGSYLFSMKHYPIPYEKGKITGYLVLGIAIVLVTRNINYPGILVELVINTFLIVGFIFIAQKSDKVISVIMNK